MRVVEGLAGGLAAGDVVPLPEPGEVGALEEQLADQGGQVGCVGGGAGQGAQTGDAGADLNRPVGEQLTGGGVEEEVAGEVALGGGPVVQARVQGQPPGFQASRSMLRLTM